MPFRLSLMMFLQWAVPGSVVPLYSVRLQEELGFSPLLTGMCCATQAAAGVVSSLLAGQVADRWLAAERAMAICAILAGLDLFLLAELRDPTYVFLATLVFWVVTGPLLLYGTTISFRHLSDPAKQFGPVRMWGTIGWMAIGLAIGSWAGDALHVGGVVAFALAGYSFLLPKTPPKHPSDPAKRFAPREAFALLRQPAFAIYCACMLAASITFTFTTQNTPLLLKSLGVETRWLSSTLTLTQASEVVCLASLPTILWALGVRWTMLAGLTAWLGVMVTLAFGRPLELVLASMLLNGLYVVGFLIAGQVYVNGLAESDFRASSQGLLSFVGGVGTLLGNVLVGWLREHAAGELSQSFAVAAGITGGILLLFSACFRQPGGTVV